MSPFFQDLRYAFRALARAPGFTTVSVASLGLGIGAVTTIFAWTDRWVLNPLPVVQDASRLTYVQTRSPGGGTWSVSYPSYRDWSARVRVFDGLTVFSLTQVGVRIDGGTERAWGVTASANYFDVLGVPMIAGRSFHPDEERDASQVAVMGYSYWQRRFHGDPSVINRKLNLNGHDFTVIGIAAARFGGAYVGLNMDLYLPVTTRTVLDGGNPWEDRGWQWLDGIARFKPGISLAAANQDMARVGKEVDLLYPNEMNHPVLSSIQSQGASAVLLPVMGALLGVTGLVLLIACANVANLLLARATARQKELGVRLAIGAGRARIVRQLLTESLLLAIAGGGAGLLMAFWGRNAVRSFIPPAPFPIDFETSLNPRVVLFSLVVTLATVVLFGLVPALRASRPDLIPLLKGLPTGSAVRGRLRGVLVASQVALSLVALVCAGLFLRGLSRAQHVDLGFKDLDRLLLVSTDLRLAGTPDSAGPAMIQRVLTRVRAEPGMVSASVSDFVPLGFGGHSSQGISVDGYTPAKDENMSIEYARVSSGYFETMGLVIRSGRSIGEQDLTGAAPVAVVNEAFVKRFWPGQDPVGKQFSRGRTTITVVGVVQDSKHRQITEVPYSFLYYPIAQGYTSEFALHVHTTVPAKAMVEPLRKDLADAEPTLPFLDPRSMSEQIIPATIGQRMGARMLALFGGVALVLAAIGLYGVMSYSVNQRTREIGVRLALGADSRGVVGMVLRQGLRLTAIGLVVGGVLSLGAGMLLRSQLFGLSPADPVTFGALALLLAAVATGASILPARRAARVDPIIALRSE
jgi:predicted permease